MPEEDILHQEDVEEVIGETIEETVGQDNAAIADVAQASVGYVQAEANAVVDTVNSILAALRNNGIVAEA